MRRPLFVGVAVGRRGAGYELVVLLHDTTDEPAAELPEFWHGIPVTRRLASQAQKLLPRRGGSDADVAAALHQQIARAASESRNEREFQAACTATLATLGQDLGIDLHTREQYVLAAGRADAVYNRLVIEYEAPGSMRANAGHAHTKHAIQQAKDYMDAIATRERQQRDRMLGIALDGSHMYRIRVSDDAWVVDYLPWSPAAAQSLARAMQALSSGRALLPTYLVEDFGAGNASAQAAIAALHNALRDRARDPLVESLFRQWQTFFSEVSAYQDRGTELGALAAVLGGPRGKVDSGELLFSIHTYFCLIAKLIAHLVVTHFVGSSGAEADLFRSAQGARLREEFIRLERGDTLRAAGVANLLEADLFGWYLNLWNAELQSALQAIVTKVAAYDPATLEEHPEAGRDLLKKLYHYLLPRELRHAMGEYYTPDWLASRVLATLNEPQFTPQAERVAIHRRRLLDPACGSGTFLVLAIRALKENALRSGLSKEETLELILSSVIGIDLNPLAVLASRVGYLLSVADLLPHSAQAVVIPVYLADSVLTPASRGLLFERGAAITTVVGRFMLPPGVRSPADVDIVAEALHETIEVSGTVDHFLQLAKDRLPRLAADDESELRALHAQMSRLHAEGRDGVWARILKNAAMPLYLGEFDYIAGNPPWINWESLPVAYRAETAPLWAQYALLQGGKGSKLGRVRVDLSVLMTCVVADRLLRSGGKLAFLITQSVFKSSAGAGFRRFRVPSGPLEVLHVDDMTELQPFEGASNRTASLLLQKGKPTKYPVPYTYWRPIKVKGSKRFTYDASLAEVEQVTARLRLSAVPVASGDETSHWLTARTGAIRATQRLLGPSDYRAHAGVCTWANGIYWVEVLGFRSNGIATIRNVVERGKRDVQPVETEVEAALLYRLVRSGEIGRWHASSEFHQLLPYEPHRPERAIPELELETRYPLAHQYFHRFREQLINRAGYQQLFARRGDPFYSVMDVGRYTFATWKVVWPSIASDITAAVLSEGHVPQHTATLISVSNEDEADYLAAVLNSRIFRFTALSYSMRGGKSFGSPHLLENIAVPRFDSHNSVHTRLSSLGRARRSVATDEGVEDDELDALAAQAWALTDREFGEFIAGFSDMLD